MPKQIVMLQPENFEPEFTTAWSFPERGAWATHNPKYRGNFAPQIARNLILKYSQKGDLILDPMVGSGTTLIEAKLLHRHATGIDINQNAVELSRDALNFEFETTASQNVVLGDARNLSSINDHSVDLVITHPPYLNILKYSENTPGDLSLVGSLPKFCVEMQQVAQELFRVLKPNKFCAILIGDTRKAQHYVPLAYNVLKIFLSSGFLLKEDIIKAQHNCTLSKKWIKQATEYGFYLIMHEHLFVLRKPTKNEDLSRFRWSATL